MLLCCTFGFTVDGWEVKKGGNNTENNNEIADFDQTHNDYNENEDETVIEEIPKPVFINPLTGLVDAEDSLSLHPLSFVLDGNAPTYGISCADILIDLPTEMDSSRYLCISTKYNNIWKIGSLAPTRDYITNLASF